MAILTISRQVGSLGNEIARAAADMLGYECVDKSQISEALANLGFSVAEIDKYDEKKPTIWQTLSHQKDQFAHLIQAAVYKLAAQNNVVIIGRGGQAILKDIPGTLHIRVIAPYATRLKRLMEEEGFSENEAQQLVRQKDRDSAGYLRTYFNADWNNGDLYDLIINTRAVKLSESVEMIARALETDEIKNAPQISELLHNHALTHKAKSALLNVTEKVDRADLVLDQGVAYLSGLVRSPVIRNRCEQIVLSIQGINSVENQLNVRDEQKSVF